MLRNRDLQPSKKVASPRVRSPRTQHLYPSYATVAHAVVSQIIASIYSQRCEPLLCCKTGPTWEPAMPSQPPPIPFSIWNAAVNPLALDRLVLSLLTNAMQLMHQHHTPSSHHSTFPGERRRLGRRGVSMYTVGVQSVPAESPDSIAGDQRTLVSRTLICFGVDASARLRRVCSGQSYSFFFFSFFFFFFF